MFEGADLGLVDTNGRPILCGSRVRVTLRVPGYPYEFSTNVGGRTAFLSPKDWRAFPDKVYRWHGTVTYRQRRAEFVISFDTRHPPEEELYKFLRDIEIIDAPKGAVSDSETEDYSQIFLCDRCGAQARHLRGAARLCCRCYVEDGGAPSDWHDDCLKAYAEKQAVLRDPKG